MDFSLSREQSKLTALAAQSATFFSRPGDAEAFAGSVAWDACAKAGWTNLCLPKAWGGGGYGALDSVLAFEALGLAGAHRGALFAMGAHLFGCGMAVANHAGTGCSETWGPQIASGNAVGALALSEPSGGSDMGRGETSLFMDGHEFTLNGTKTYVTNGIAADLYVVNAFDPDKVAPMNMTTVLVPAVAPGVSRTAIVGGTGLHGTGMATVAFDQCTVTRNNILGREGGGMGITLSIMRWERSCILSGALGALERELRAVTSVLHTRCDSRGPLTQHQAVAHRLTEIRRRIESARWLMYRAAWELDQDGDPLLYPALSKLTLGETLVDCGVMLQSVMGGAGWANALGLAEALQDAMAMAVASGTADIQRNTIATRLVKT